MNRFLSCAAAVGLLVASSSGVFAGSRGGGASHVTPAAEAVNPTSSSNPLKPVSGLSGAEAFAPGQQMRNHMTSPATAPGNGAAVYAPGFLKNH
jgi:hypothetical protein